MGRKERESNEVPREITKTDIQLIDFLYLDIPRLDSYISQLKNGTLRSVSKTIGANLGYSTSYEVGVNVAAKATIYNKSDGGSTENSTENYDPFHSQFIDLFNVLNLDTISFEQSYIGKLGILESFVTVRDFNRMSTVLPVIANNKAFNSHLTNVTKGQLQAMGALLESLEPAIDITLHINGKRASGTLKEEFLSISVSDIIKNYGNSLPGKWVTIGIFDSPSTCNESPAIDASIESIIDMYNLTINSIYAPSDLRVTPIAVFRELNV